MARVSWSDVGQRFYEAGTDRGVLFVPGQDGVPWNGLIGVNESPTGGEPKAYYSDGYKYLNLASAEEYVATIRAYASPREFDICDGTAPIHNGLFATQQTRKSFGLTYRTLVGNDTDGLGHGYKIHLVYNALAASADRAYETRGSNSTPLVMSWTISTLAPIVVGVRPTAHFVIDSRRTPPLLLEAIENILYGTEATVSRLILPQELVDMFKNWV